jgi:hypothetical protein
MNKPAAGWIVNVTPKQSRRTKQFLVAIQDANEALSAVSQLFGAHAQIALGVPVFAEHILRRSMQPGDIFDMAAKTIVANK